MLSPRWPILGSNPRSPVRYNANGFVRRTPSRLIPKISQQSPQTRKNAILFTKTKKQSARRVPVIDGH